MNSSNVYALERVAYKLYNLVTDDMDIRIINMAYAKLYFGNESNKKSVIRYHAMTKLFDRVENFDKRLTVLIDHPFVFLAGNELVEIIELMVNLVVD